MYLDPVTPARRERNPSILVSVYGVLTFPQTQVLFLDNLLAYIVAFRPRL